MTIRDQLAREIAQAPDAVVEELLDFLLFIKQRREQNSPDAARSTQSGMVNFLAEVQAIQAEVPAAAWENLPHDGGINPDHYLYGAPKIEISG